MSTERLAGFLPAPSPTVFGTLQAGFGHILVRFRAWQNRRAVAGLLEFDERMLRDIGVTRGDVASALALPSSQDPSLRLAVISVERRSARRAQAREQTRLFGGRPTYVRLAHKEFG
jgi:uncharacterized protein YjiS (DUF1127 family)